MDLRTRTELQLRLTVFHRNTSADAGSKANNKSSLKKTKKETKKNTKPNPDPNSNIVYVFKKSAQYVNHSIELILRDASKTFLSKRPHSSLKI